MVVLFLFFLTKVKCEDYKNSSLTFSEQQSLMWVQINLNSMLSDISDLYCLLISVLVCDLNNTKICSVKYGTRYTCQDPFLPSSPNCSVAEVLIGMYHWRIMLLTPFESLDDGSQGLIIMSFAGSIGVSAFGRVVTRKRGYGHQQLNYITMPDL